MRRSEIRLRNGDCSRPTAKPWRRVPSNTGDIRSDRPRPVEGVKAGMRRARPEGRHIGRQPVAVDREAICCDRRRGQSLRQIAKAHRISRATVHRVIHAQPSTENAA